MKQIAYESKYVDSRLPALLVEQFMLSWRAPAEYANTAQLRLEGFKGVLEGRSNGLDFLLKKGKMEFYLEFMCMVKTGKEQRIMTDSLDELTQFYVALVKQQFYEESDEQAKKCNLLLSLRKYFVSSIKHVPQNERKSESVIIRAFSNLVALLLLNLEPSASKLNSKYVEHA